MLLKSLFRPFVHEWIKINVCLSGLNPELDSFGTVFDRLKIFKHFWNPDRTKEVSKLSRRWKLVSNIKPKWEIRVYFKVKLGVKISVFISCNFRSNIRRHKDHLGVWLFRNFLAMAISINFLIHTASSLADQSLLKYKKINEVTSPSPVSYLLYRKSRLSSSLKN